MVETLTKPLLKVQIFGLLYLSNAKQFKVHIISNYFYLNNLCASGEMRTFQFESQIMRWSQTYISTLREDPQEAEIISHKLMLRAGLIRRLSGGLYTFLPLGLKALRKVEKIVREEMDRAGAVEVLMPAVQPQELWEQSNRFDVLRNVIFKITDRQSRKMVLGPTHEEVITHLAAREIQSYRQLPVTFYQIQTKFRDEIRPRFGLMRAKEFIMKDAYSFDTSWEGVDASYQSMYDAYRRIFDRCALHTRVVEADSGAMGGNASHEFMVVTDCGEDGIVECSECDYAANLERAEYKLTMAPSLPESDLEEIHTPGKCSIDEVSKFLDIDPSQMIKTLIYQNGGQCIAVLCRGDREICEQKLCSYLGVPEITLASDETVKEVTTADVGFAGPLNLSIQIVADKGLEALTDGTTGANKTDYHLCHVSMQRDIPTATYADIVLAQSGDHCPRCDHGRLKEQRGVEVGHVFKLGTKYCDAFDATFLDEDGKSKPMIMGCYGIGVTRTLQAAIEQSHDDKGIIWPVSIAPFHIHMLVLNPSHAESMTTAEALHDQCVTEGYDVLLDDRDDRPGVKFNDADLIGMPIQIIIGERSLKNGDIEIKSRVTGVSDNVKTIDCINRIRELLA
jgi:prolyl-tRNA synthetase